MKKNPATYNTQLFRGANHIKCAIPSYNIEVNSSQKENNMHY